MLIESTIKDSTASRSEVLASDAFMLVYSIKSLESLYSIASLWRWLESTLGTDDFPVIIVGNHCSSRGTHGIDEVTANKAISLSIDLYCQHIEVDCASMAGVEAAFFSLALQTKASKDEQVAVREALRIRGLHEKGHSTATNRTFTTVRRHQRLLAVDRWERERQFRHARMSGLSGHNASMILPSDSFGPDDDEYYEVD
jgi:hypothetical protein